MRIKVVLWAALLQLCSFEAKALTVFACEPEWASLVEEIGGEKIKVFTATTAFQDAHYVQARPSLIANMRKADMVVCSGAGLEIGWLPILFQKSGSPKAVVMAADYVETLDKPIKLDRSDGDVHPEGNPHLHLNPYNILKVSDAVLNGLIKIDNENKSFYETRHNEFREKWSALIKNWEKNAKKLQGINVISQHKNLTYLFDWLKIGNVATLEPKPGVPPTTKHLNELINVVNNGNVKFILHTPFEDSKAAKWLSDKTKLPYLTLPYTVGGDDKSGDLFGLYDETIRLMLEKQGE